MLYMQSCSSILLKKYGYHDPKDFTLNSYNEFINSFDTLTAIKIISDTSQFKKIINLVPDSIIKNHLGQPVQILNFTDFNLVSFHANCFARGSFSGLDWNFNNDFNSFPPTSAINIDVFKLTLNEYSNIYNELNVAKKKYTVIVFWSWMFENVSKDAIKIAYNNFNVANKSDSTNFVLINIDKYWAK